MIKIQYHCFGDSSVVPHEKIKCALVEVKNEICKKIFSEPFYHHIFPLL